MPPKKSQKRPAPAATRDIVDAEAIMRRTGPYKLVAELIAETDTNLPDEQIDEDIKAFAQYADNSEWRGIAMYFNSLSSMSRRASTYPNWDRRFDVVDYLQSCFNNLKETVTQHCENTLAAREAGEVIMVDVDLVNAVNMFVILASRLTVQLQLYVSKKILSTQQSKRGAKNRNLELDDNMIRWKETQRMRMITCLLDLLNLKVGRRGKALQLLFSPEPVDPDLLQRFHDTVSNLLEDPENAVRANFPWLVYVFRIWKALAKDYDYSQKIANSIFTDTLELGYLEAASSFPFIEPLSSLMREIKEDDYVMRTVLQMIVRRACGLYSGARDVHTPPKAYCMIIQALAIFANELMLQEVTQVYQLLHNNNPSVRCSALQALADLFSSQYLTKDKCEAHTSRKNKRDSIFKKLVAHTHDESILVRAKALSMLRSLVDSAKLPEEYESSGLLNIVGSRMCDKSVQVRKSAIQFMTTYLDKNKFGHDFTHDAHIETLDKLVKQFHEREANEQNPIRQVERSFGRNCGELKKALLQEIPKYLRGEIEEDPDNPPNIATFINKILEPATTPKLVQYYVSHRDFPYKVSTIGAEELQASEKKYTEQIHAWMMQQACDDYVHFVVQMNQANDELQLEREQLKRDNQLSTAQLRAQMQNLVDKMVIAKHLAGCIEPALRCVLTGEPAEIKEAIKFLTRCKLFEIPGADAACRSMCSLVWRPGNDVINELIDAAEDMYISKLEGNDKINERDKSTVESLLKAMHGATRKDRASVEEVIYLLASAEEGDVSNAKSNKQRRPIHATVIGRLWNIALDSTKPTDAVINESERSKKAWEEVRRRRIDAMRILYPISRTEKGITEARLRLRMLQKKLTEETEIAVEALRIISILSTPTKKEKDFNSFQHPMFRIHQEDSLMTSIENLFFHEVIKANDSPQRDWFGIMRLTVSTLINVFMDFNTTLTRLASNFLYRMKRISEFFIFYEKQCLDRSLDEMKKLNAQRRRDYWAVTWCRCMEKLMAFCGEVASQLHAFIQVTLPKLRRRYIQKISDAEKCDKLQEEPPRLLTDLEKSMCLRKTIFAIPNEPEQGDRNDLHPVMLCLTDRRLFAPGKLLGRLLPIVAYGIRAESMPERIKEAAATALGKFMPISSEIASFAAPSFYTLMTKSPALLTRCNLTAACCDFAFAQPTLFELYFPGLFRMCNDKKSAVRESAILVLSHLMSNDMIQARGLLSEAARCTCDEVSYVKDAAQSFFRELNARNDTVVQYVPEFIYRFSCTREKLPFKQYKLVLEFLFYILKEKSKSMENLIERICTKFASVDMSEQEAPRYLLVPLSKFGQADSGIHKLQDNWRHWSKFLCNPQVAYEYRRMIETIGSNSKLEDVKLRCADLVKNIAKIQEDGLSKDDLAAAPTTSKKGRRGRPAASRGSQAPSTSTRTPKKRRRAQIESDDEEEEEEEDGEEEGAEDVEMASDDEDSD